MTNTCQLTMARYLRGMRYSNFGIWCYLNKDESFVARSGSQSVPFPPAAQKPRGFNMLALHRAAFRRCLC